MIRFGWGQSNRAANASHRFRCREFVLVAALATVPAISRAQSTDTHLQSEFGTVISHSPGTVDLQVYDPKLGVVERHRYLRTAETRADAVHAGDEVQVLFVFEGNSRLLRRVAIVPARLESQTIEGGLSSLPPAAPVHTPNLARGGVINSRTAALVETPNLARGSLANSRTAAPVQTPSLAHRGTAPVNPVAPAPLPSALPGRRTAVAANSARTAPVELGGKNKPVVASVVSVPLGIDAGYSTPAPALKTRDVAREAPTAACHASDTDWPMQPLSIAVLDFRYPTAREEAHDQGTASGGSGMAVADIVYSRLKVLPEFSVDRGDRERLDRSDIAGAARLGRKLGADAVIEGTFFPVEETAPDGSGTRVRGYELRAGLVDTCTGQVLMKMSSVQCPAGAAAGAVSGSSAAPGAGLACKHLEVSAKAAGDPAAHGAEFAAAVDALLDPLEHNGQDQKLQPEPPGRVVGMFEQAVTVKLSPDFRVKIGDQLSLHANRLAKNPSTYTLNLERDDEIGRLTVRHLDGIMATCSYAGDIPPRVGDVVEVVAQ